jgi:hypothetical protein
MLVLSRVLAPCGFVGGFQSFRETFCLCSGLKWRTYIAFEEGRLKVGGQLGRRDVREDSDQ